MQDYFYATGDALFKRLQADEKLLLVFSGEDSDFVRLNVYDLLGREVDRLVNDVRFPGTYSVTFDAQDLSDGVYFYELQVGDAFREVKKMVLVK